MLRRVLSRLAYGVVRQSDAPWGIRLRGVTVRGLLASCGPGIVLGPGARIIGGEQIDVGSGLSAMGDLKLYASGESRVRIGDDCSFNDNVWIGAGPGPGAIEIGDAVLIGPNTVVRNCDHVWRDGTRRIRDQGHACRDIVIEDDVWLAANIVVLGGAHIQSGAVVAAGAVVRRGTYEPGAVLAGNPAVQVGTRGEASTAA